MPDKITNIILRIEKSLKKEFQIWCLKNDTDMSKVLNDFIKETLKKKITDDKK